MLNSVTKLSLITIGITNVNYINPACGLNLGAHRGADHWGGAKGWDERRADRSYDWWHAGGADAWPRDDWRAGRPAAKHRSDDWWRTSGHAWRKDGEDHTDDTRWHPKPFKADVKPAFEFIRPTGTTGLPGFVVPGSPVVPVGRVVPPKATPGRVIPPKGKKIALIRADPVKGRPGVFHGWDVTSQEVDSKVPIGVVVDMDKIGQWEDKKIEMDKRQDVKEIKDLFDAHENSYLVISDFFLFLTEYMKLWVAKDDSANLLLKIYKKSETDKLEYLKTRNEHFLKALKADVASNPFPSLTMRRQKNGPYIEHDLKTEDIDNVKKLNDNMYNLDNLFLKYNPITRGAGKFDVKKVDKPVDLLILSLYRLHTSLSNVILKQITRNKKRMPEKKRKFQFGLRFYGKSLKEFAPKIYEMRVRNDRIVEQANELFRILTSDRMDKTRGFLSEAHKNEFSKIDEGAKRNCMVIANWYQIEGDKATKFGANLNIPGYNLRYKNPEKIEV